MNNNLIIATVFVFCVFIVIVMVNIVYSFIKEQVAANRKFTVEINDREDIAAARQWLDDWRKMVERSREAAIEIDANLDVEPMDMSIRLAEHLDRLLMDLEDAVSEENYERAANLRDEISKMKTELKKINDE
jgi:excinuclease UvrABC helicase subunit UvrB